MTGDLHGESNPIELIRRRYGPWAATYGDPTDDGWFARIRARENRIVRELLPLAGHESLLDAGCGPGHLSRELKQRGHEVWAVDCVPEMIDRVRGEVDQALVADLQSLHLGRRFDAILCIGALEFVGDPAAVMRRLRAHLVDGGRLVVLVPRSGLGGWVHHLLMRRDGLRSTLFSPAGLRRMCGEVGLEWIEHRTPFVHNFVAALRAA